MGKLEQKYKKVLKNQKKKKNSMNIVEKIAKNL